MNFEKTVLPPFSQENVSNNLDKYLNEILSIKEKQDLLNIFSYFSCIKKMMPDDYYSFIESISKFCIENDFSRNIIRCSISGIIPAMQKAKFKKEIGSLVLLNIDQISVMLQKSKKTIHVSFLEKYGIKLTDDEAKSIFSNKNNFFDKIIAYKKIISILGYNNEFYFIRKPSNLFKQGLFKLDDDNSGNNSNSFRHSYQIMHFKENQIEKKNINMLNKTKQIAIKIQELVTKIKNKNFEEMSLLNQNIENINFDKINLFSFIKKRLKEIDNLIFNKKDFNSCQNSKSSLPIMHKKRTPWNNLYLFKFGFLIEYCSASAYNRLYELVKQQIPPISTINSHFEKDLKEKHFYLSNSYEIAPLLDKYWENNYAMIAEYICDYNKKFHSNLVIKEFKIDLVLGSDAASLTRFNLKTEYNERKNYSKEELDQIKYLKEIDKECRKTIFTDLVNGSFDKIEKTNNFIEDKDAKFFFTFTLQPFNWKLPIIVVHLEKSLTGHFSKDDALNIKNLFNIINHHPHFKSHFFAADGDKSLDSFHKAAFEKYKSDLKKYINKKITLEEFVNLVEHKCFILPVFDLFHACKIGRDKLMNNTIKLGEKMDLINYSSLSESLGIKNKVLHDDSTIGKMNDNYILILFTIENAINEFNKKHYSSSIYILFYSLLSELYRNPFMNLNFRIYISKFLLSLLILFYDGIKSLPSETGLRVDSRTYNKYVWFDSDTGCIQLMNTLIGMCICLKSPHIAYCFGIERYSSHPDEQFFGRYRDHFIGNSTIQNAFNYAIRSCLALDFEHDFNISFRIPKRENFGGVHLNFHDSHNLAFDLFSPPNFDLNHGIEELSKKIYQIGTGAFYVDEQIIYFFNCLNEFFQSYPSIRNGRFSTSKGGSIVPRIIAASENANNDINIIDLYDEEIAKEKEMIEKEFSQNINQAIHDDSAYYLESDEEEEEEEENHNNE